MPEQLSLAEAKSLVLNAQGLAAKPDKSKVQAGPFGIFDRLGLLQLDSVNVFERAHYLPVFSRIGPFNKATLDEATAPLTQTGHQADLIEYWAHEASWIRTEDLPLHRFRMDWYRFGTDDLRYSNKRWLAVQAEHGELLNWIRAELAAKGPLTIAQIEHDQNKRKGNWWGWSDVKTCLERMFLVGDVVSAGREGFSRRYALPNQVLEGRTLDLMLNPNPDYDANIRELLTRAAKADGVATVKDLADFVRLKIDRVAPRVAELVAEGTLVPTSVAGWKDPTFVHCDWLAKLSAGQLAKAQHTTLLSPFDPITRYRERAIRVFGFDYKIEIYTPEPKRVYGYYTLPLLHNGELVGRIDLKSERKTGQLLVQASWHEPDLKASQIDSMAKSLAKHLDQAAKWQGLTETVVMPKGNLAAALDSQMKIK